MTESRPPWANSLWHAVRSCACLRNDEKASRCRAPGKLEGDHCGREVREDGAVQHGHMLASHMSCS